MTHFLLSPSKCLSLEGREDTKYELFFSEYAALKNDFVILLHFLIKRILVVGKFVSFFTITITGARDGAVGWGTTPQNGRLWVLFPEILLSVFSSFDVHSACNRNEYQGLSLGAKVRPAPRADNSAVLVVLNVKVRMESQDFISPLSLNDRGLCRRCMKVGWQEGGWG